MSPYCSNNRVQNKRTSRALLKLSIAILSAVFTTAFSAAQDLTVGVTYVCSGERMYIENCNIRDSPTPQRAWSAIPTTSCRTA